MTNEVATVDDSSLELLPPKQPPQQHAVAMLHQHAAAMNDAYDLAVQLVKTEMVPVRYRDKPDEATAAILYGAELGLPPVRSLQEVFAVHGSPAIYARTMAGLLKKRGYKFRAAEKTDEAVEVWGWEPGSDINAEPDEKARWTIEDAERAGYTTNRKYKTEPRAMLYAKALAEVCRHMAPDVLLGIAYSVEEMEAEPQPPKRVAARRSEPVTVEELFAEPAKPEPQQPEPHPDHPDQTCAEYEDAKLAEELAEENAADEPAESESEPETVVEPITAQQLKLLAIKFRERGFTDQQRQDRLDLTASLIGRPISSAKELTRAEASQVIDTLEN